MRQPKYRPFPKVAKRLCVWEDATSYSQRDPYPRVPRSFRMRLSPDVQIIVISEHIYHKGKWVVTCAPWFETTDLGLAVTAENAPDAKRAALAMVRAKIDELTAALATLDSQ